MHSQGVIQRARAILETRRIEVPAMDGPPTISRALLPDCPGPFVLCRAGASAPSSLAARFAWWLASTVGRRRPMMAVAIPSPGPGGSIPY